MKLEKKHRERLYKAKGKSIVISWPGDSEPHNGKRYVVYNDEGEKLFSIRVERSKRLSYEIKATIRLDEDPFRPMIGIGGVRREDGGYETEPERVPAGYEDLLCMEAQARNALHQATIRNSRSIERKESTVASSPRSQRAKERHLRTSGSAV